MKIYIADYRAGDVHSLRLRPDFIGAVEVIDPRRSYSLYRGIDVVACGGYVEERADVFTLWGRCQDDLTPREWLMIRDKVCWLIEGLFDEGANRVQSFCYASDTRAAGFLRQTGLTDEIHCLKAYGPNGSDFLIAAKLRGA